MAKNGRFLTRPRLSKPISDGSVAEWSNAPLSKSGMAERSSGVRILSLPPTKCPKTAQILKYENLVSNSRSSKAS